MKDISSELKQELNAQCCGHCSINKFNKEIKKEKQENEAKYIGEFDNLLEQQQKNQKEKLKYNAERAQAFRNRQKKLESDIECENEQLNHSFKFIASNFPQINSQKNIQEIIVRYNEYKLKFLDLKNEPKRKKIYQKHSKQEKQNGEYKKMIQQQNRESAKRSRELKKERLDTQKKLNKDSLKLKQQILKDNKDIEPQLQQIFDSNNNRDNSVNSSESNSKIQVNNQSQEYNQVSTSVSSGQQNNQIQQDLLQQQQQQQFSFQNFENNNFENNNFEKMCDQFSMNQAFNTQQQVYFQKQQQQCDKNNQLQQQIQQQIQKNNQQYKQQQNENNIGNKFYNNNIQQQQNYNHIQYQQQKQQQQQPLQESAQYDNQKGTQIDKMFYIDSNSCSSQFNFSHQQDTMLNSELYDQLYNNQESDQSSSDKIKSDLFDADITYQGEIDDQITKKIKGNNSSPRPVSQNNYYKSLFIFPFTIMCLIGVLINSENLQEIQLFQTINRFFLSFTIIDRSSQQYAQGHIEEVSQISEMKYQVYNMGCMEEEDRPQVGSQNHRQCFDQLINIAERQREAGHFQEYLKFSQYGEKYQLEGNYKTDDCMKSSSIQVSLSLFYNLKFHQSCETSERYLEDEQDPQMRSILEIINLFSQHETTCHQFASDRQQKLQCYSDLISKIKEKQQFLKDNYPEQIFIFWSQVLYYKIITYHMTEIYSQAHIDELTILSQQIIDAGYKQTLYFTETLKMIAYIESTLNQDNIKSTQIMQQVIDIENLKMAPDAHITRESNRLYKRYWYQRILYEHREQEVDQELLKKLELYSEYEIDLKNYQKTCPSDSEYIKIEEQGFSLNDFIKKNQHDHSPHQTHHHLH